MDRVVYRAVLFGRPGPKCLQNHIVQYILTGEEPDCTAIPIEQLQREDIVTAVKEIDAVTEETQHDMLSRHADLLETVGFRKVLNVQNKDEAIMAVKSHYYCYRCLPAILQFMDGGSIRSTWLNLEDGREENVQINMGHLLQSRVGSPSLPVNITSGIMEFDHTLKRLTTVNTCAPSIIFCSTVENQDYEKFEESFLNITVASYEFGMS